MRIIDCQQGTPEWWEARRGIPTASRFDSIITPKTAKPSAQAWPYICELIADRVLGTPMGVESYTSRAMQDGIDCEPEARAWYALERDVEVRQVGFCVMDDGAAGCSPDGLIGDDGGLELKCPLAKTHVGYLLDGVLPTEYKCQVYASLVVTGRAWWDFASYCLGFPPLVVRVTPDDFTAALRGALDAFTGQYREATARFEALGGFRLAAPAAPTISDEDAALDMFTGKGGECAKV